MATFSLREVTPESYAQESEDIAAGKYKADPWHTTGPEGSNADEVKFMDLCKNKFKLVEFSSLPVDIGRTGYIEGKSRNGVDVAESCWCVDDLGRFVCIISGRYLIFQRYTRHTLLIHGPVTDYVFNTVLSGDVLAELTTYVNSV